MTAAVESLHRAFPGQYLTSVQTTCQELWAYNPRISDVPAHQCHIVDMRYDAINQCGQRAVGFMAAFCEHLGKEIGKPIPLLTNKPHLYLGPDEGPLDAVKDIGPYVVVNCGRKADYTAKFAGTHFWQQVVDRLKDRVTVVQVGEANPHHLHRPVAGTVNLVGQTSVREFLRLVRYARAAAGPVSFLLHASAAFGVPYVCAAGGREEASWVSYSSTVYLHTLGQLDCCKERGCWKSRTVPLGDGDVKDRSLCTLPVIQPDGEYIPKCLQLVAPDRVTSALHQILDGGA
jgi:ADP-heptose:LPS heptosyltransferase